MTGPDISKDGGSADISFAIQIPQPDTELAAQFANKDVAKLHVISGGKVTDVGDTIVSYDSIKAGTTSLNLKQMAQLGVGLASAQSLLQQQLDTLQPGDPQIPVLANEINLISQMVTTGTVPSNTLLNLGINPHTGDVDSVSVSSTGLASAPKTGTSKWFAGNAYVAFENLFTQLIMMMMKGEAAQAKLAFTSLQMGFALAKESAEDITNSANLRAQQQFVAAVTDLTSGIVSGLSAIGTAYCATRMEAPQDVAGEKDMGLGKMEVQEPVYEMENGNPVMHEGEPVVKLKADGNPETKLVEKFKAKSAKDIEVRNQQLQAYSSTITAISGALTSGLKSLQEFYAAYDTQKAGLSDADKAIVDAIIRNVQEQTQKALESIKTNQDTIEQILQSLKTWFDQLSQQLQASVRKGS